MAKSKNTSTAGAANAAPVISEGVKETGGGNTVVVALNQPQAIVFRLFKGEGDTAHEYKRVRIEGNAAHLIGAGNASELPRGGYGFTTIPADDWEEIKRQYGTMHIFKNGLIFAASGIQNANAQAKEHAEIKSGYEPIDTDATLTSPKE